MQVVATYRRFSAQFPNWGPPASQCSFRNSSVAFPSPPRIELSNLLKRKKAKLFNKLLNRGKSHAHFLCKECLNLIDC